MNKKRTFTQAEKLKILREAGENGVKPTLEKHGIYPVTFYGWRKNLNFLAPLTTRICIATNYTNVQNKHSCAFVCIRVHSCAFVNIRG